jgi:D-alanine-D-alanine ligase
MKIGLTYDLKEDYLELGYSKEDVAEFDTEETISGIENSLKELNFQVDRIGRFHELNKRIVSGEKWDMVFNICEGIHGISREAQVPALLEAYNIPYVFSDPLVLTLTLHKGMAKRVVRDAGIPTAEFYVVEELEEIESIKFGFPMFAKPVAEGTGKGVSELSKIENRYQLTSTCRLLLEKYKQPVLVEKYLPGREFTVGIVGTGKNSKVVGMMEVNFKGDTNIYSFESKDNYEELVEYSSVEKKMYSQCAEVALAAWKSLGCRDGGRIDIRFDEENVANFIEVNPLAGLNHIHSDLPILCRLNGIPYRELIKMIVNSAIERHGTKKFENLDLV